MGFKEKRREQASLSHQYGICDQISEEISVLKDRRCVLEKKLNALKKKEQQLKWYEKSKLRSNSSSSSSSGNMKRISSGEFEHQQAVPPFSGSETLTSGSLTYSQTTATESALPSNQSLNSAVAGDTSSTSGTLSICEEMEDSSVPLNNLKHFQ